MPELPEKPAATPVPVPTDAPADARQLDSLPTTKVARAARFAKTGLKVGANYVKHYARRSVGAESSTQDLHEANAADLYGALSEMKGSVLKVAQMLAMEKNMLPTAYADQFAQAQYQSPPLSGPLVIKVFRDAFGRSPFELFDEFDVNARQAASIGQVHFARLKGRPLAVKVQYPGVADSIKSDIRLVKPIALRVMGLNEAQVRPYLEEVETRLLEETNYALELRRGTEIGAKCAHLPHLEFASYYPELSSSRILTMDWLGGQHLKEFLQTAPSQAVRDQLGQALWDFYAFQMHTLRQVHADPHPGNFLLRAEHGGTVGVLDFGCVKEIPADVYELFTALLTAETLADEARLAALLTQAGILRPDDAPVRTAFYISTMQASLELVGRPFRQPTFDFGDPAYLAALYALGDDLIQQPELRQQREPRGSEHFIYLNRTYVGLYALLTELGAVVQTGTLEQSDQRNHLARPEL
ncbi:Predicted unusual protein kinase regulating ubiquinone biosynthesis, AarF/ABC1/UbiB family [Hymenobacter daecheongensis DSM 21074]|uniref:Predicted unusual protein kinase regulating ubiquinone biosynthesis, AarF/ABC1/UbiB family n=1 Tax=Hymenobacter daecheongensis DSM 21074 TaxID=1121955 RepID=A0A1M6EQ24_9BACT|nr:AarF/ABC1/UbiB kinase family protein [Hymenobacter daecheongensis]SHI87591.1 Predicted unusual protein kinase regulating ubiquinone biosynthesis, AarF/ABC1/UbiB family [Hymenobacter daecheongensis DSM 21074]